MTDKTLRASKGLWYTGIKLHLLGMVCNARLPHPETPSSINDLALFRELWACMAEKVFFGDRIYFDRPFFAAMMENCGSEMLAPIKHVKGTTEWEKNFFKAAVDMYSAAVCSVRSTAGPLLHVFAKPSTAVKGTIFKP